LLYDHLDTNVIWVS